MMASSTNILLDTFPGLSLPPTVSFSLPSTTTTDELLQHIAALLPDTVLRCTRLLLTTTNNKYILPSDRVTLADFIGVESNLLPLRLSVPLCGGKGGFGSQLRAAGGRMSSRKRKQNAELATGSARNLDGRRLRTITEAKNLAAYLATKPDMDRKQKEERRKRWEQVVELAEQREADMRSGKGVDGRRKGLSDEWIETKEEVSENVRNAVNIAIKAAESNTAHESSVSASLNSDSEEDSEPDQDIMELDDDALARLKIEAESGDADAIWVLKNRLKIPTQYLPSETKKSTSLRRFAGFDEDDDEFSTSEEEGNSLAKGKVNATGELEVDSSTSLAS